MVVLIIASVVVSGIFVFLTKQRRATKTQRLKADIESMAQISFFIIGRDLRRAGSNPAGAMGYDVGAPIPLAQATTTRVEILADLNGDGDVPADPAVAGDERIIYEFVDDPSNPDGIADQIRRQAGNQLVIENVRDFHLKYQLVGDPTWYASVADPALIRKVRLHMVAGTGRINSATGVEDTKEIRMDILLRNFR